MFTIKTFPFNLLQENTYVVSDETHECVIIDCGAYYEEERKAITDYITGNGLRPTHLLATHGHWDHNLGIDTIFNAFGVSHHRHPPQLSKHHRCSPTKGIPRSRALLRQRRGDKVWQPRTTGAKNPWSFSWQRRFLLCPRTYRLHW